MRSFLWGVVASVALGAGGGLSPAERAAAKSITEAGLRAHIRYLASDLLEGRFPASRGDQLAEHYIASQFEALGLKPGAPGGGWFQPFDIVGVNGNPQTLTFNGADAKALTLNYSKDFVAYSLTQQPESKLDRAEVVLVGYGIIAP